MYVHLICYKCLEAFIDPQFELLDRCCENTFSKVSLMIMFALLPNSFHVASRLPTLGTQNNIMLY